MKEKKDRVDDALHATKAALEEGILPGGGIALLNGSKMLVEKIGDVDGDEQIGYDIVVQAAEKPFYQILENAGYTKDQSGDIEEEIITKEGDIWAGYNLRESKVVNMFKAGIIDPTKVTRLALANAASVAGTMLITETVVSNIKKENETPGIDPSMMM